MDDCKKIIVIDDETSIRDSFRYHLEDLNFKIITAANGREGLDLINKENPDMILLDLRMPEMDGIELLRIIKESHPDTPKLVISGANRIEDVVRALRYGAMDYIVKPVKDLTILEHSVRKSFEKARLINENREYQQNLEKMVKERTLDLEKANTTLEDVNKRLRSIVETTKGLSACVDIKQFGARVLEGFSNHMGASGGSIFFVEKDGLKKIATLDQYHVPEFIKFPLDEKSVLKKVLDSGKPFLVKDIHREKLIRPSGWQGYENSSFIVFPISGNQGEIIGVLTLHGKSDPPFIEQDKEIGAVLASYSCETLRAVQAYEDLQSSEKLYRALFEKSNDGFFIIDRESGCCMDANVAAVRFTGKTVDDLKASDCRDFLPPRFKNDPRVFTGLNHSQDMGQISCKTDENEIKSARVSAVPVDQKRIILIVRDITHDLEMEKQLRYSQKMEAIGTLAGGIAHDFNNILSGIFGYAQLVSMSLDDPVKARKNIDQILSGSRRAAELVEQILTFSRQAENKKKPLKLFLVVKEAVKFLRSSIPANIEIKAVIESKSAVLGDPVQVHQVVMNLCTNAYHAMRQKGGILRIELKEEELGGEKIESSREKNFQPGKYIRLEVKDTGHGIDPQFIERIFDPYFTTKQQDKGTGLGLAVVSGIVKKHKGFLKVHSVPGEGSCFQVFWPVADEDKNQDSEPSLQPPPHDGAERIMVVDDETGILEILKEILGSLGYSVHPFSDGESALKSFQNQPQAYDLVVTDMAMPRMTGAELSARILNIDPHIPIILCTGFSENFDEQQAMKIGIKKYLHKPVNAIDLSAQIREILDSHPDHSDSV